MIDDNPYRSPDGIPESRTSWRRKPWKRFMVGGVVFAILGFACFYLIARQHKHGGTPSSLMSEALMDAIGSATFVFSMFSGLGFVIGSSHLGSNLAHAWIQRRERVSGGSLV